MTVTQQPPELSFVTLGYGPAIVLLHGMGNDHRQALQLLPADAKAHRIAPDMPGHGATPLEIGEPVSFASFASHVIALVEDLDIRGPVDVAGISMGAGIALAVAHRRPDLVRRLALVRPSWAGRRHPRHLRPLQDIAALLGRAEPAAAEATFTDSRWYRRLERTAPATATSLVGQFRRGGAVAGARVLAELPRDLPVPTAQAYRDIRTPTIVVVAPDDPVHPVPVGRALARLLPGAALSAVPAKRPDPARHLSEVQRLVGDFFDAGRE